MNLRAVGCIVIGSLVVIGIGQLGLSMATSRIGCPDRLQWIDTAYLPTNAATESPTLPADAAATPVEIGSTFIGLTTRKVYGPAPVDPTDPNAERPTQIALECGDGTYQAYAAERTPSSS
jgi:hypothetical protein